MRTVPMDHPVDPSVRGLGGILAGGVGGVLAGGLGGRLGGAILGE